jgi:hypothetical protein
VLRPAGKTLALSVPQQVLLPPKLFPFEYMCFPS